MATVIPVNCDTLPYSLIKSLVEQIKQSWETAEAADEPQPVVRLVHVPNAKVRGESRMGDRITWYGFREEEGAGPHFSYWANYDPNLQELDWWEDGDPDAPAELLDAWAADQMLS